MNRLLPLVIVLALLTGVVAGQLYSVAGISESVAVEQESRAIEVAETFYEGLNKVLEEGDVSQLLAVLDQSFVDHSLPAGAGTDAERLAAWLMTLASASPGIRIEATPMPVEGGLVISTLLLETATLGSGLSPTPNLARPHTMHDLLRIQKNRVVERWTSPSAEHLDVITPIAYAEIDTGSMPRQITLERITLPRLGRLEVPSHFGTMLMIETGSLEIGIGPDLSGDTISSSPDVSLVHPGETRIVPASQSYWLRNAHLDPTVVLKLTLRSIEPAIARSMSSSEPPMISAPVDQSSGQLLASGAAFNGREENVQIRVDTVFLGSGASVAEHVVHEAELVLVIDGSVEAVVREGLVGVMTEAGTIRRQKSSAVIQAGAAAFTDAGSQLGYQPVDGSSATFLLITITS